MPVEYDSEGGAGARPGAGYKYRLAWHRGGASVGKAGTYWAAVCGVMSERSHELTGSSQPWNAAALTWLFVIP